MNRVVVTGLGVVSPAGVTVQDFWANITTGADCFREPLSWPGSGVKAGAVSPDLTFKDLPLPSLSPCDRNALLAVAAARDALADAGLRAPFERPERVAVVLGNGAGGLMSVEEQYDRIFRQNRKTHPFTIVRAMTSSSASWTSLAFGTQGPCFVTSSACASGAHAIGMGLALVRSGIVDIAIVGGTEAPLSMGTLMAWDSMKVMSRTRCRPFSRNRDGMMISEGAGVLILESEQHARERGAKTTIELAGFASNADATDIVAPSAGGMARAMTAALSDAGVEASHIDYINAHGTGTAANDATEARALAEVYGAGRVPPVSSIKGITGHSLGAAGAIEAVATVLAMQKAIAPPTANFEEPDADCDIDVIPNAPREMPIGLAMSNSFAFGGLNASLVFRQAR